MTCCDIVCREAICDVVAGLPRSQLSPDVHIIPYTADQQSTMTYLNAKQPLAGATGPTNSSKVYVTATVPRGPVRSMASSVEAATPTVDREHVVQRVRQLEAAAAEAHKAAQELNKQGKYQEAAEMYAKMRKLDAEALDATQDLGCPSCRVSAAERAAASAITAKLQSSPVYQQLHTPSPWLASAGQLSQPERATGAMVGCLVGDAAATPVQWIYDTAALEALLQSRQQGQGALGSVGLEFYDPVQSPFLPQYTTGRNSPYGEQTLLLLRSLAERQGLHCGRYADLYAATYNGFDGYMNASTVAFMRNFMRGLQPPATGADDQQADCVARLAPLVSMFAADERLMSLVEAATRTTQNTAAAVAWACAGAAVLERLLQGQGPTAAVEETVQELKQQEGGRMPVDKELAASVAGHLQRVLQLQQQPHTIAVQQLGRNCHMPNALQTPLHTVLHQEWLLKQQSQDVQLLAKEQKQSVYVAAIRDAMAAGGCCASRSGYAGACLGMWLGGSAVPESWLKQYAAADKVLKWSRQICTSRGGAVAE